MSHMLQFKVKYRLDIPLIVLRLLYRARYVLVYTRIHDMYMLYWCMFFAKVYINVNGIKSDFFFQIEIISTVIFNSISPDSCRKFRVFTT